jgi:hypothetical protein
MKLRPYGPAALSQAFPVLANFLMADGTRSSATQYAFAGKTPCHDKVCRSQTPSCQFVSPVDYRPPRAARACSRSLALYLYRVLAPVRDVITAVAFATPGDATASRGRQRART